MKEELEKEIARMHERLAWLVKMYIRHISDDRKRNFLFERMKGTTERIQRYERMRDKLSA